MDVEYSPPILPRRHKARLMFQSGQGGKQGDVHMPVCVYCLEPVQQRGIFRRWKHVS